MMKRYFIAPRLDVLHRAGQHDMGTMHWIDLGSHGGSAAHVAVVLIDPHAAPGTDWEQLPHLLDSRTQLAFAGISHSKLSPLGVRGTHTALDAAVAMAKIHKGFAP